MRPHGLILSQDGATARTHLLEASPCHSDQFSVECCTEKFDFLISYILPYILCKKKQQSLLWPSFWDPCGGLGHPWGAPGEHLGDLGDLSGVWWILDAIFRGNVPKVTEGCSKMSLSEFATGSTGSTGSTGNGVRPGRTDPGYPTPGSRMTVVNKLPQNI